MSLYLGTNCISAGGSSAFRNTNIGEIITSTIPLSDAGLHLLDGSVISGSGAYSAFVTYIAGLVSGHSELFTTEANWQTDVTTYGVCGKFVYDSVNNTVRLPKITGFIEGTIDPTVLGDLVEAGLPNITGESQWASPGDNVSRYNASGAFDRTQNTGTMGLTWGSESTGYYKETFDASRSNSIYGNSSTVQPQAIKVLYYIVIATSTKTEIEVDIDEVMTDLNGKVDIADLSTCHVVVETYINGSSWYRVYSDGWCEQGGIVNPTSTQTQFTLNLLHNFINNKYSIFMTINDLELRSNKLTTAVTGSKTINSFTYSVCGYNNTVPAADISIYWQACGYIS